MCGELCAESGFVDLLHDDRPIGVLEGRGDDLGADDPVAHLLQFTLLEHVVVAIECHLEGLTTGGAEEAPTFRRVAIVSATASSIIL